MTKDSPFVFLSEEDTFVAGALNAGRCIDVCEEVFTLLHTGDYVMGGPQHNSPGQGLHFPLSSPLPSMPLAGPDRRFVAKPAYVGGRFDVCGNVWSGSNPANAERGLPSSVSTLMVNDKKTGEPLCLMAANLISAAVAGAVPAVAARHLTAPGSAAVAVLGCGSINRAVVAALVTQRRSVQEITCCGRTLAEAETFARWVVDTFDVTATAVATAQECVAGADIITVATPQGTPLSLAAADFPAECTILLSGPLVADEELWTTSRVVFDALSVHQALVSEAVASPDKQAAYDGLIGGPIYRLMDNGRLPALPEGSDLAQLITSHDEVSPTADLPRPGRSIFVTGEMAVFDVAWGYEIFRGARRLAVGEQLHLWNS